MDLSNVKKEAASNLSSNRKRKIQEEEDSMAIIPPKNVCHSPPTFRQNWLLPDSIIYYFSKNPLNSKGYQKLIQSCKYFFHKNPILVCSGLFYDALIYITQIQIIQNEKRKLKNFNNISQSLWIKYCIKIDDNHWLDSSLFADKENVASIIIPHIYQCDAKFLTLRNQYLSFNDFIFLASNTKHIDFHRVVIKNKNGAIVALEKLVKAAVNAKTINIYLNENNPSISLDAAKNLLAISHFSKFNEFGLSNVPEFFDINTFFTYIKKNKQTNFELGFSHHISEDYKNKLVSIIDEINGKRDHEYKVPWFEFSGLTLEKRMKFRFFYLRSRHLQNINQ